MNRKTFFVGIDLGTSNCTLSYKLLNDDAVKALDITQHNNQAQIITAQALPSFLYIPYEGEEVFSVLSYAKDGTKKGVLGEAAKSKSLDQPDRVLASAKSWLCNPLVDRKEPILPWLSDIENKWSPVEASTAYLQHLMSVLKTHLKQEYSEDSFDFKTVITVPASFDEVARNLTMQSAQNAGIEDFTLLEEPQAAFYAWLDKNKDQLRSLIKPQDLVLVCDVGGGTCDFSLIEVQEKDGDLNLERINVGSHLLLGGDNMDLALASLVASKLKDEGKTLDAYMMQHLVFQVRQAKEQLLNDTNEGTSHTTYPISLSGRGSKLFASNIQNSISKQEIETVILDGFFNFYKKQEGQTLKDYLNDDENSQISGLISFDLNYEKNPSITKHLLKFLALTPHLKPTKVLFNGGVFHSKTLRKRLVSQLNEWLDSSSLEELQNVDLDMSVSLGACHFAYNKHTNEGHRIIAGTTRSYYIGLEDQKLAVPGIVNPLKGLCIASYGRQEGSEIFLKDRLFGLVTGRPVTFRFFSTKNRREDKEGQIIEDAPFNLEESACLQMTLQGEGQNFVPVYLKTLISDVGVLNVYMQHRDKDEKWQLEFDTRPKKVNP